MPRYGICVRERSIRVVVLYLRYSLPYIPHPYLVESECDVLCCTTHIQYTRGYCSSFLINYFRQKVDEKVLVRVLHAGALASRMLFKPDHSSYDDPDVLLIVTGRIQSEY